jgi:hypothetical protein
MGLGTHRHWGGVSRRLTVSRSGSSEDGGEASKDPKKVLGDITQSEQCTGASSDGGGGASKVQKMAPTAITRCKDARGLLVLVQQHGPSLSAIQVVAAWDKVASMPGAGGAGAKGEVLQELQFLTRAMLHEMGARQVANVVRAMQRLRMGVDSELARELQARARDFKPEDDSIPVSPPAEIGIESDAAETGIELDAAEVGTESDAGLEEAMQGGMGVASGRLTDPRGEVAGEGSSEGGGEVSEDTKKYLSNAQKKLKNLQQRMMFQIKQCSNARKLLEMVKKDGQSFSAIQVDAAWDRAATMPGCSGSQRVPEVDSNCRLLVLPLFCGSSRFESLILSHHSR